MGTKRQREGWNELLVYVKQYVRVRRDFKRLATGVRNNSNNINERPTRFDMRGHYMGAKPTAKARRPMLVSARRLGSPCTRSHSGLTTTVRNHRYLGFPLVRVRGRGQP